MANAGSQPRSQRVQSDGTDGMRVVPFLALRFEARPSVPLEF